MPSLDYFVNNNTSAVGIQETPFSQDLQAELVQGEISNPVYIDQAHQQQLPRDRPKIQRRETKYSKQRACAMSWMLSLRCRSATRTSTRNPEPANASQSGKVMDVLVQHHPEYVALAWGAMKLIFGVGNL